VLKNKYHNVKCEIDGIKFDSLKEGRRYKELKLLEAKGEITDLELQPVYLLQEKFKYNGESIRAIKYIGDFRYFDISKQCTVVEDVKGQKTKEYLIKRKLFLKKYGNDLQFYEV